MLKVGRSLLQAIKTEQSTVTECMQTGKNQHMPKYAAMQHSYPVLPLLLREALRWGFCILELATYSQIKPENVEKSFPMYST